MKSGIVLLLVKNFQSHGITEGNFLSELQTASCKGQGLNNPGLSPL